MKRSDTLTKTKDLSEQTNTKKSFSVGILFIIQLKYPNTLEMEE